MPASLPVLVRPRGDGRLVSLPEAQVRFSATAADTGGRFELYEMTLTPTEAPLRRHVHKQLDELVVVLAGRLEGVAGDRHLQLGPGDTLFVPRGTPHAWCTRGPGPAAVLLHYSPSGHRDQYFERLARLCSGSLPPSRAQLDELGTRFDEFAVDP